MLNKKMGSAILIATMVVGTPLLAGSANSRGLSENARNGLGTSEITSVGMFGTGTGAETGTKRLMERYSNGQSGANGTGAANGSRERHQNRNRYHYGKPASAAGGPNGAVTRSSDGMFLGSNGASGTGRSQNQAGKGLRRGKN